MAIAREGKLGPASEELELLAHKSPVLADRCSYEAGLLNVRRGSLSKAIGLFAAVSERSYFFAEARLAMARVQRLQGNLDAAAAAVEPLTSSPTRSVRRRALVELSAIAQLSRGERGRRDAQLRLTAERAPWLGGAPALAVITGSNDTLLQRNECRDAKRVARQTANEPGCSARLFAAEAQACVGKDVSPELRRIVAACRQPEVASRAWMTLGVLHARNGNVEASVKTFREAANVAPTTSLAAEALFTAFWVGWKATPASPNDEDLVSLDALPVELSAQDRARIRYWRSKVADARGNPIDATRLLTEIALAYPATWYGHLARARLASLDSPVVDLPAVIPMESDDSQESAALALLGPGLAAVQMGLADGVIELTTLARLQPHAASNRLVIEVLNATGAHGLAYRFARSVLREQAGTRQDAMVWHTAYPPRFAELIEARADEANVAPALLQGLVREESSFEPTARSHCGALGLMQLMPVTARALAIEQGRPLVQLSDLHDPQLNVGLGSRYVGQLLRRFNGDAAVVAAAYNGGPTRVARWLKAARPGHIDEWVEEIPLNETRNYVKDVLASADVYRQLLEKSVIVASTEAKAAGKRN